MASSNDRDQGDPRARGGDEDGRSVIANGGNTRGRSGSEAEGAAEAPPWRRSSGAEQSVDRGGQQAFDVGQPQHVNRRAGARPGGGGRGGASAEQASGNSLDAPTGFMRPVGGTTEERAEGGTSVFGRSSTGVADPGAERGRDAPSSPRSGGPSRGPRRANLTLRGFDPWSVLRLSLVLAIAGFFVWLVAVAVLYLVLGGMGVWDQLNTTYSGLTATQGGGGGDLVTLGGVFSAAAVVGLINIVLFTALVTVSAYIYNVASDMAGGVELTLSERD